MIDFSNYTINQQQAMSDVLHDLVDRLEDYGTIWEYLRDMRAKSDTQLTISIDAQFEQQALKKFKEAYIADAHPVDIKELEWQEQAAPPAEDPDGLRDLQALVDDLYRCAARLGAWADAEDEHFAECSRTEVFNKVTMLRKWTQAVINAARDIRDHYDGLH